MLPDSFIPPHGGYRDLLSYQKAEAVFDLTCRFCERFLRRGDRTIDQMIQAARSGKQNIVEGCQASGTSKEMEIKLIGVARASLEELLNDYLDYLRTRRLPLWPKDSKEALFVRNLGRSTAPASDPHDSRPGPPAENPPPSDHRSHPTHPTHSVLPAHDPPHAPPPSAFDPYREFADTRPDDVVANIAICLIHQANYLLDQQLRSLEQAFLKDGGLRERMTRARRNARGH